MGALLIINYDVTDPERMEAYRQKAAAVLLGPDSGAPVAVTDETVDLGEGEGAGRTTVVLRYASVEGAREAYFSEDYQALLGERLAASAAAFAVIVPTIDG